MRVYYSTCNALCARKIDRICVSVGSCCLLQASMFLMMSFSFQNLDIVRTNLTRMCLGMGILDVHAFVGPWLRVVGYRYDG